MIRIDIDDREVKEALQRQVGDLTPDPIAIASVQEDRKKGEASPDRPRGAGVADSRTPPRGAFAPGGSISPPTFGVRRTFS